MKCREFNLTLDVASITVMLLKTNRFHNIVKFSEKIMLNVIETSFENVFSMIYLYKNEK